MPHLFTLVLQIAVILIVCRIVGALFQFIRQPRVVGEMFAGILLGPSLLGWLFPGVSALVFPASSLGYLNALSQVGMIIYMFLVGLRTNPEDLKGHGPTTILTSHVSIVAPFVLSSLLAIYLYPMLSDDSVSFTNFGLFMGAAMSITAFPVLARILAERNMIHSTLGALAISCAAVDDVTGWCILACIVVLIRSSHGAAQIWTTLVGVACFVLAMIFVVQRLLRRFGKAFNQRGMIGETQLALILVLAFLSALCTEWLGIHLLFGAFLMGVIMPKDQIFVRYICDRFESVTVVLLLPLFFAFTGLRTSIALLRGYEMWMYFSLIVLVAIVGKLGGSMLAAKVSGMPLRDATRLGVLMNTRGLMELVILNIGLDIKVISPTLFCMMILMALFTTFMTTPVLDVLRSDGLRASSDKNAQKERMPVAV
jgi:Kef-type K+ transport system membrane component KefB